MNRRPSPGSLGGGTEMGSRSLARSGECLDEVEALQKREKRTSKIFLVKGGWDWIWGFGLGLMFGTYVTYGCLAFVCLFGCLKQRDYIVV